MKFTQQTITYTNGIDSRQVDAMCRGLFGFFKDDGHKVVHIPTGYFLVVTRTITDAKSAIAKLMAMENADRWQSDDKHFALSDRDFRSVAYAIRQKYQKPGR